jgi:hypothetical protein
MTYELSIFSPIKGEARTLVVKYLDITSGKTLGSQDITNLSKIFRIVGYFLVAFCECAEYFTLYY